MRQSLELALVRGSPGQHFRLLLRCTGNDFCEEPLLREEVLGSQTGLLSSVLNRAEIDVGRQVLVSGVGEDIVGNSMLKVATQRSFAPFRLKQLILGDTVVECE